MTIEETSIERLLEDIKVSKIDNVHFQFENIQKYLGCSQVKWLAMHENGKLVAACGIAQSQETSKELDEDGHVNEVTFLSTYICQLSSLVSGKGYGKSLLESILDKHQNAWLKSMPGTETFYRLIARLHEHTELSCGSSIFVKSDKFAQRICDLAGAV